VAWLVTSPARADESDVGWKSRDAYDRFVEAQIAARSGLHAVCIEKANKALAIEENLLARVQLAGCYERADKVLAALRQMQVVLEEGLRQEDAELAELARKRVEQLLKRLGHVRIVMPRDASDATLTIDGIAIPKTALEKPLSIDPGEHEVHGEASINGVRLAYDDAVEVKPGETATIRVTLKPPAPEFLTAGQLACVQAAQNQAEVLRCLPSGSKNLIGRAYLDMGGYADTLNVRVINPSVSGSISSPTAGFSVGARYLVDVISAASPDFVSTASRRGKDTRHAASVDATYKPGRFGASAAGAFSTESDYIARSGTVAVMGDFADKQFTPRVSWTTGYDTIGRGGTPTSVFSHTLVSNEANVGASFVLGPSSVLMAGVTAAFERGDQSKPYRLIPLFAPGTSVPAGASPDLVNATRLPIRPYEQLPLERDRYALSARLAQRIGRSTLRAEGRAYLDTWDLGAGSLDVRYMVDAGTRVLFWPHVRVHAQTGANFFHRVYSGELSPNILIPTFRTTDRELSPLLAGTMGFGAKWTLSAPSSSPQFALLMSGDVMLTRYFDALYVSRRYATYGNFGLEVLFE
jgi:hypothetical protein